MDNIFTNLKSNPVWNYFWGKSTLARFIYINIGVFLLIRLILIITELFNLNSYFLLLIELPAYIPVYLTRPWSLFSYMFIHRDLSHLFFNMLWLYWFGQMFVHRFTNSQLTAVYLLGGISGGLMYLLAFNVFPFFRDSLDASFLIGASASILAIVMSVAIYDPNYKIRFFLLGDVSLKIIAIVTVVLDLISVTSDNAGGHWAHIGGILLGLLFGYQMRCGVDITKGLVQWSNSIASLFKKNKYKPKMKVSYQDVQRESDGDYNARQRDNEKKIDSILDKIKKSGYGSLSDEERKKLFEASNKS